MAYDLAGLREEVLFKLQHHDRFTDADVNLALNRGIDQLVIYGSENYEVWESVPPPDPNDASKLAVEYTLPTDLLYLKSVSFDSRPLKQLSQPEFVNTGGELVTDTGAPIYYYIRANLYLNLYPRPLEAKKVQIYYLQKPTDLSADADVPVINRVYSDALVSYACYWLLRGQPEEDERANRFLNDYQGQRVESRVNLHKNSVFKTQRTKGRR